MIDNIKNVNSDLIDIALEKTDGESFEKFSQDFCSVIEGRNFVPLGGVKDGGADGLYQCEVENIFYQFTKQQNHREKIRVTARRLVEFGRTVKTIYYLTPRLIPYIDQEEDSLSDELGIRIKIRDKKYISSHINDSVGTIAAYENHLQKFTDFLKKIDRSGQGESPAFIDDPSAFVFLQHEVTNRLGNRKLIHSITDSLILWSLSDTDPDEGILMSENEIKNKIFASFPWATKIIQGEIRRRLLKLRAKAVDGREVRWYGKEKKYCLPYETRKTIQEENKDDESLSIKFMDEIKLIAANLFDSDDGEYQEIAELCRLIIHMIFEKQGLLFSHFICDDEEEIAPPIVSDCIDEAITKHYTGSKTIPYREYLEDIVRKIFYDSSPNQREYLNNLSRTYVLLFTLQAEPRVIDFFSTMSASFHLFLGSDIIVKALSERYLAEGDQVARNLLKISSASGIKMYLSECVLEEVYQHIRGTYYEFIHGFAEIEPYMTKEIARHSDKILIRAYFYAKFDNKVKGWKSYLEQFITYNKIPTDEGREELRQYLMAEYNLEFVDNDELLSNCNSDSVTELAERMHESLDKKNMQLAYNTALLVHGIYGRRIKNSETKSVSEFGYKTWWMTNQTRVLQHTTDLIRAKRSQFIMRPEYVLNFIGMSPNCAQVRNSFQSIFPSIFGIQLGHRLKGETFHKVIDQVKEWKDYESGRRAALMSKMSDDLKTDRLKRYQHTLDADQYYLDVSGHD